MKTITTIESLAMMTTIGVQEIEVADQIAALRFAPIISSSDRALLSMTSLGCREIETYERVHPCQRRA